MEIERLFPKILGSNICFKCTSSGEDKKHLLVHCEIASKLWMAVNVLETMTMPEEVKNAMHCLGLQEEEERQCSTLSLSVGT